MMYSVKTTDLDTKIIEFKLAMEKYNSNIFYNRFWIVVANSVIILQVLNILDLSNKLNYVQPNYLILILLFVCSYIMTDFVNGLIHLFADNFTKYTSIVGPFSAAFHLHHKRPKYKNKHAILVYFQESGAKLWLPFYLLGVIYLQSLNLMSFYVNFFLVNLGILSSFAEVSHYWCHNATADNKIIKILQKYKILLAPNHHKYHHIHDNVNYAFLNGITDPLINMIAKNLFHGYKNYADLHAKAYSGMQTSNR